MEERPGMSNIIICVQSWPILIIRSQTLKISTSPYFVDIHWIDSGILTLPFRNDKRALTMIQVTASISYFEFFLNYAQRMDKLLQEDRPISCAMPHTSHCQQQTPVHEPASQPQLNLNVKQASTLNLIPKHLILLPACCDCHMRNPHWAPPSHAESCNTVHNDTLTLRLSKPLEFTNYGNTFIDHLNHWEED